jgi:hypothetical protein
MLAARAELSFRVAPGLLARPAMLQLPAGQLHDSDLLKRR